MDFITQVSCVNIYVGEDMIRNVTTITSFSEDETNVYLKSSENVLELKRGLVCDLLCEFNLRGDDGSKKAYKKTESIKDLVLVYINKNSDKGSCALFEYIFYK